MISDQRLFGLCHNTIPMKHNNNNNNNNNKRTKLYIKIYFFSSPPITRSIACSKSTKSTWKSIKSGLHIHRLLSSVNIPFLCYRELRSKQPNKNKQIWSEKYLSKFSPHCRYWRYRHQQNQAWVLPTAVKN